jgi:hypothetical protein
MHVNMTSTAARLAAAHEYAGDSKPLSIRHSGDRVNDRTWWAAREKREALSANRHPAALRLYLGLAECARPGLRPGQFPASFEFLDMIRMRPDKGWIKAALRNNIIDAIPGDELIFELTPTGENWLNRSA